MPDFGIGEAALALGGEELLGGLFGGDFLGGLFGGGEAAAGALGGAEAGGAALGFGEAAGAGLGADVFGSFGAGEAFSGLGAEAGGLGAGASDVLAAGGTPGLGAASFAPAPGVELGGAAGGAAFPDATAAAAQSTAAAAEAVPGGAAPSGVFGGAPGGFGGDTAAFAPGGIDTAAINPPGTESSFGARFAGAPTDTGSASAFAPQGGAQPPAPFSSTAGATPPGGAPGGGLDVSGNPMQGPYGSNPGTPYGGVNPQYDPTGATVGSSASGMPGGAAPKPGFLDSIGSAVSRNPVGTALGAGGLGYAIMSGQQRTGAEQQLANAATAQQAEGAKLASYLNKGTLPPGLQSSVDTATQQAKANAISNAAGQGLPTDPTRNTALAATLASIDAKAPQIAAQIAQQLLSSGAQFTGLSNQLYTALANIDLQNRQSMGKAIANFAGALGNNRTTIQIGGTAA